MSGRNRGFVLVNALVLVAALAGVATLVLGRAETARARLLEAQGAGQLRHYLGAVEALAIARIGADAPGVDHAGETWAAPLDALALDRGRVSGRLHDMQGRFNLNWLANPADTRARAAFDMLAARAGIAPPKVAAILAFLRPGGPGETAGYARANPPLDPVGGALLMQEQLVHVPGLTARDRAALAELASVLPGDLPLNVNTAPPAVLGAFLGGLRPAALDQLVQARRAAPFASVEEFKARLIAAAGAAAAADLPEERLAVGSAWFAVEIAAALDGRSAQRRAVLERRPPPERARLVYRLDRRP